MPMQQALQGQAGIQLLDHLLKEMIPSSAGFNCIANTPAAAIWGVGEFYH
jgi:hypothetical protein